jgi:hypothetical protein
MAAETAAERYARDYHAALLVDPDRVTKTLLTQPEERWSRLYVAPDGSSAVDADIS